MKIVREALMCKRLLSKLASMMVTCLLFAFMIIGGTGCGLSSSLDTGEKVPPKCGNGIIEVEEQCDKYNLGGATCNSMGEGKGKLMCDEACRFDFSMCVPDTSSNGYGDYGTVVQ
jgi:hypothetical protein